MEMSEIQNDENNIIEDDESDNFNKKNNREIQNIQSSLNLKKYEQNLFYYFVSINKINICPRAIKLLYVVIETIQLFSLFYNNDYFPTIPKEINNVTSVFIFRNILDTKISLIVAGSAVCLLYFLFILHFALHISSIKFPNIVLKVNAVFIELMQRIFFIPVLYALLSFFDCDKDKNDPNAKYICFTGDHLTISLISLAELFLYVSFAYLVSFFNQSYIPLSKNKPLGLSSNTTIINFRRIMLLEVANLFLFQVYFNLQIISSILLFAGFVYLIYTHYNYQDYYKKSINCFYSAIWSSMALSTFVYIFFSIFRIRIYFQIFVLLNIVGLVIGWFSNTFYYNWYSNKVYTNIEKKYNQQHVISKLKEQIEFDHPRDDEERSLETIVTEKKVIKKENVYNRPSDCAYVSKFVLENRSIEGFKLVHSLFKEGVNQFELIPEIYIQYWYFLHGMRKFMNINQMYFTDEESEEFMKKVNYVSDKALFKCANLSKSLVNKFLVYNATYIYESDKVITINRENSQDNKNVNFELNDLRHKAIQYHLGALNGLKNFFDTLKSLENPEEVKNAINYNNELTDILNSGESHFKKFVVEFNYSKESLELYVLFLRNSLNREDLAGQYIQMLEENEDVDKEEDIKKKYGGGYERSEKMSSSMNSDMENRKTRILKKNTLHKCQQPLHKLLSIVQIVTTLAIVFGIVGNIIYMSSFTNITEKIDFYNVAAKSPVLTSQIINALRHITLLAAQGIDPRGEQYDYIYTIARKTKYLNGTYFPVVYPIHDLESRGYVTIHPLDPNAIDDLRDINYYQVLRKIYKKAQLIIDGVRPELFTPEIFYRRNIRFFLENSKGQFGDLLINSLDETNETVTKVISRHETMFYILAASICVFMFFTIFKIIIPNSNKSEKSIKEIICLFKTLPPKFFNEQANEYSDQIQEVCDNYEVEDEGQFKKIGQSKRKNSSSLKFTFIIYCFMVIALLLIPFLIIFFYTTECKNLINFLTNSTKRGYYVSVVNHYDMEIFIKDRYYFREGEELTLLTDTYNKLQKLENDLKSGKFGGKTSADYKVFDELNNNPGCVRSKLLIETCNTRKFTDLYTKELSESPLDYIVMEYLNKLNEFINNPPTCTHNLVDPNDIAVIDNEIRQSEYVGLFFSMSDDIIGHIDRMNELASDYLFYETNLFIKIILYTHIVCSFAIFIIFFIFVSIPIKKQLRVIDSLINITYSVPSSVYNASPKLKIFIENGKLEE
ncbi:hypothetical protein BCR32DRAFT_293881 [Anaeromyces robustus]|uniref:Uncharacterized protein n=1 Tax=Anaeromyces robustus TaxID=1754192 RepID=A0A1Y1X3I3_9FUNG|nr:hypothetical protein BCR32DRAFT_293881 [Anaeromyces robustus]|eukprot:ORX80370.1 hypothetical protein BCR32DRAFT_293881 [Anaeromyces robustus]